MLLADSSKLHKTMYRGSSSRRSKDESTQRLRYRLDRLRLGPQPNRRVSAAELRMRLKFNQLMREKKSKMGDRNHPSSPSQIDKDNIEDDWIEWMLIWKTAASIRRNRAHFVEEHMETDQRALVLLKKAFLKRSELEQRKRNGFLSPQDAAIRIQMSVRAYLRKKSKLSQEIRDLSIADTKLKKIRCSFKDSSYRDRLARDPQENQRFAEIILVLLLTIDAIEGANVKIRLAKKYMVDELEKMLDKVENRGRQSQHSVSFINFSHLSYNNNNKDKGKKSTSEPASIRIEDISDPGAVVLRKAFTRGLNKERSNWQSPIDAAVKIQMSFRAYLLRRSQALQAYRELALAETKLGEIRFLFHDLSYRHRVARDVEERQRFAEKIIVLLLTVDAIEGTNVTIRSSKKSMLDELETMLDVVDNRGNSEKNSVASMEPVLEEKDEETTDHGSVLLRRAFLTRVGKEKEKWNELSPVDAAIKIQRSFRNYLVRKSQSLKSYQNLAVGGTKLKEIKSLFNNYSYRRHVARDAEERQRFAEKIIVLLLTVDAIEGTDVMIRSLKKSMLDELEAMLDVVDPQPPATDLGKS